jgi:hypothetical protein
MWNLIKQIFSWLFTGAAGKSASSSMNEGDFHSGPHGYSPNTAYSNTEYGDLNWDEREH